MSTPASPFHEGEQRVQQRLGVRDRIEPWARRVVRDHLPEEHRRFYAEQPFLVAAARDETGRPWATLLAGGPGFARSPSPRRLEIAVTPFAGEALGQGFALGDDVGLLGIEFATRRRNRVNGRVVLRQEGGFALEVEQSFGNCPQHIEPREWVAVDSARVPHAEHAAALDAETTRFIERANTFFVASGHRAEGESAAYGMDASHRGGPPGFVRVVGPTTLEFPDYSGNDHFNTIGNLVMDPRIGLLFVDFEAGHLLQLSGRVAIDWDSERVRRVPGARRLVRVEVEAVVRTREALPMRWRPMDAGLRSLRVAERVRESDDVTSFLLEPADGQPLPAFEPGQHLPVELSIEGVSAPASRTYSLSATPESGEVQSAYRISVKREPDGLVSRALHDRVELGARLRAAPPAGDFVLRGGERPVVLVSAGVGVTPMRSMLGALAREGAARSVLFVHGARDGRHHPFADEVRDLVGRHDRLRAHVSYSRPLPTDRPGVDFDREGRVDGALLASLLPGLDADFYLCGPIAFMSDLEAWLEARGVPAERIHSESFGGAGGAGRSGSE